MDVVTDLNLWTLIRHAGRWLVNLSRAGRARREASRAALRGVVVAARRTRRYLRAVDEAGERDATREAELSALWSELGFRLADLGLGKLAKRCDVTGRYWADPETFDAHFLAQADVGLERMERLAREVLATLD